MFPLIKPEALAIPTITPVKTTRWFSLILLLLYQVDSITLGVLEPIQRRKQAKYATPVWCTTSIVPRIMKPDQREYDADSPARLTYQSW